MHAGFADAEEGWEEEDVFSPAFAMETVPILACVSFFGWSSSCTRQVHRNVLEWAHAT